MNPNRIMHKAKLLLAHYAGKPTHSSPCAAHETRVLGSRCGMAEALVKTLPRDEADPHEGLKMRSPREYRHSVGEIRC